MCRRGDGRGGHERVWAVKLQGLRVRSALSLPTAAQGQTPWLRGDKESQGRLFSSARRRSFGSAARGRSFPADTCGLADVRSTAFREGSPLLGTRSWTFSLQMGQHLHLAHPTAHSGCPSFAWRLAFGNARPKLGEQGEHSSRPPPPGSPSVPAPLTKVEAAF